MLEAVIGHLPVLGNNDKDQSVTDLSMYLPIAVFGYLGYQFGFETVVVIPLPIPDLVGFRPVILFDELVFSVSYLRATVYTAVALLFVGNLNKHTHEHLMKWYNGPILIVVIVVFLGAAYAGLWAIYAAELYAVSLIGLVLSVAQFLVLANFVIESISRLVLFVLDLLTKIVGVVR